MNNRTKNAIDLTATVAATCFLPVAAAVGFGLVTAYLLRRRAHVSLCPVPNPHRKWDPFACHRMHEPRQPSRRLKVIHGTAKTAEPKQVSVLT